MNRHFKKIWEHGAVEPDEEGENEIVKYVDAFTGAYGKNLKEAAIEYVSNYNNNGNLRTAIATRYFIDLPEPIQDQPFTLKEEVEHLGYLNFE